MKVRTGLKSLLPLSLVLTLGQVSCHSAPQKTEAEQIVDAFKAKVDADLQGHASRTDVWEIPGDSYVQGGWRMAQVEVPSAYSLNVVRTDSLVSPYLGTAELIVTDRTTYPKSSKEEALGATQFKSSTDIKHRLTYAYQNGAWAIKTEQCFEYDGDAEQHIWVDCSAGAMGAYGRAITTP
jgi:hypothetical protein